MTGCKPPEGEAEPELNTQELLQLAADAGFRVSAQRLQRWISAGLFVRGRRPGRGKASGRGARLYPAAALPHFLQLCRLAEELPGQKAVGWELWWRGFAVDEKFWHAALKQTAVDWDRHIKRVKDRCGGNSGLPGPEIIDAVEAIRASMTLDPMLKQIRKRVPGAEFDTFLLSMVRAALGVFGLGKNHEQEDELRIDRGIAQRGLGLARVSVNDVRRKVHLPRIDHEFEAPLELLASRLKNKRAEHALKGSTATEIEAARSEIRSVMAIVREAVGSLKSTMGKRASALNTVEAIAEEDRKKMPTLLVLWICAGPKSELRAGIRELLAVNFSRE